MIAVGTWASPRRSASKFAYSHTFKSFKNDLTSTLEYAGYKYILWDNTALDDWNDCWMM
jgi:hypothetical protein